MKIKIENSVVEAETREFRPRCIDISTHLNGRKIEVEGQHWPETATNTTPYITFRIKAEEPSYDRPEDEQDRERYATEQITFVSIEQAREIHKALGQAIDCADVK
jgi:hypothetical protein